METKHRSDSSVQRDAESAIIAALSKKLGLPLVQGGLATLAGEVNVQLDAHSVDDRVVVESYARQGSLKGGQLKKVAQDVLKLAAIRRQPGQEDTRTIVVFASPEALSSVSKWVRQAAADFGVELLVVDIDDELRAQILNAQSRQKMVNAPVDSSVSFART